MKSALNDFFPYKVCINLDTRPDRWARAKERFARHHLNDVIRFPAVDGARLEPPDGWNDVPGALGCLHSHLSVVGEARKRRAPTVLIFEDDVDFDEQLNEKFFKCAGQIPSDWDMILLGGSHWEEPVRWSDNIFKATSTAATHAYALKQTIYDAFIALNGEALHPVDVNNTLLQRDFNCYCLMPHLAWQEEGYSDIAGRTINTWRVKESIVLCSAEMEQVLKKTAVVIAHKSENGDAVSARNLNFLINHYASLSPDIAIVIVDRDRVMLRGNDERGMMNDEHGLPCSSFRVHHSSFPLTRSRAFNSGFEMFDEGRDFFIFTDSDIVAPWPDIKANLIMCLKYDFVSLFKDVFALNREDTQAVLNGRLNSLDVYGNRRESGTSLSSGGCIMTRKGFLTIGGWDEMKAKVKRQKAKMELSPGSEEEVQSRKVRQLLTVFESPNPAVRLHSCEPIDRRAGK